MKKTIIFSLYLSVCCWFVFSVTGQAYIDPSTTTYIIQAIAGVAIAVGAFVTVYWRKAKRRVEEKLHIDAKSKKEIEEDLVISDDVILDSSEDTE